MTNAVRNVGRITCPFCLSGAKVHRNKSGRLYIHCRHDGPINVHGDAYQDYIEDNMGPYEVEPEAAPVTEPEPVTEPAPVRTEIESDDLQDDTPEPEPEHVQEPEQESGWGLL